MKTTNVQRCRFSLVTLFAGFALSGASASTVYVDASSPGPTHDGATWATAFPSIGEAVEASMALDEIWVARGVYTGSVPIGKNLLLYGGFAGTEATREARRPRENPTILDAGGAERLLVLSGQAVTVDGFTLRNTDRNEGVAVSGNVLSVTVRGCFITQNGTGVAAGLSSCTITQNTFAGNAIGVSTTASTSSVVSNVFIGNVTGIDRPSGIPRLHNNTFVGNVTGIELGGNPTFVNCIFAWNGTGVRASGAIPRNCCFYENGAHAVGIPDPTGLYNNKVADPRLVAAAAGEIHLLPGSPCINSGVNTTPESTMSDIDGAPRLYPSGGTVDIGADEFDGTIYTVTPRTIRVRADGEDAADGQAWTSAKRTLSGALEGLYGHGGEVWLAGGIYTGPVTVYSAATILGHFDPSTGAARTGRATVLDADGGSAALTLVSGAAPATVDGLRLQNGNAGANVLLGAPILANCILAGNVDGLAVDGGDPLLLNATVAANRRGIAIYAGEASIANSIVAFNGTGIERAASVTIVPTLRHNDVHGNGTDYLGLDGQNGVNGNIDANPFFVGAATGDFHLVSGSPCRGAGDASSASAFASDMDGQPRLVAGGVDIGADQFDAATPVVSPIIVRVRPDGEDANDGSTWETAKRTIPAALDAARERGGQVWVAAGTYDGSLRARPFVALLGGFAGTEVSPENRDSKAHATVLRGSPGQAAVTFTGGHDSGRLEGFRIVDSHVGVACLSASPRIAQNGFTGNGIALECVDGSPHVSDNVLEDNADGLLFTGGFPVLARNRVERTAGRAFAAWGGAPQLRDSLLATSGAAGALLVDVSGALVNNTVAHNGTGLVLDAATLLLANNVVAFSTARGVKAFDPAGLPVMRSNDVFGAPNLFEGISDSTGVDGNIAVDPLFRAAAAGDYRLTADSPCIGKGDLDVVLSVTDLALHPRVIGDRIDMGALEYVPPSHTIEEAIAALRIAGGLAAEESGVPVFPGVTLRDAASILRNAIGTD